jgi:hypothetical protein
MSEMTAGTASEGSTTSQTSCNITPKSFADLLKLDSFSRSQPTFLHLLSFFFSSREFNGDDLRIFLASVPSYFGTYEPVYNSTELELY